MSARLDIAVAGCGPGGLAAALMLTKQGHRTTLYERFETPRPIGSGLLIQPVGLAVLDSIDLGERVRGDGARIDELHGLSMPSGRRALDVRYGALPRGQRAYGVHRALLFDILFDAVLAAAIPIERGRSVVSSDLAAPGRRALRFADGGESPAVDLVVDAMGARSPLPPPRGRALTYGAIWTTLDWVDAPDLRPAMLDQRYTRARQMAGILPIGLNPASTQRGAAYFWSLKVAEFEGLRATGLERWRDEAIALWPESAPLLEQLDSFDQFTLARYAHRTVANPVAPALVHIGDAWHSTSPQLGQGANMAMLDAAALAAALAGDGPLETRLSNYARMRRLHVRLYQAMSALFTPLYQSDHAALGTLRDLLTDPVAGWWPFRRVLATMVAGSVGAPLRRIALASANERLRSTHDMSPLV